MVSEWLNNNLESDSMFYNNFPGGDGLFNNSELMTDYVILNIS